MAISATAEARAVGIGASFADLRGATAFRLPQRIAVVGQGATASTFAFAEKVITSAEQAGSFFGFGSPLALVGKMLFPANGDGVGQIPVSFFPVDDDGSGVVAAGDITPSGTQTGAASYHVECNGIKSAPFVIVDGAASDAALATLITDAINAAIDFPLIAVVNIAVVDLTSKWKGVSANECVLTVVGPANGITFALTQPAGGLVNPDVDTPLALIGALDWRTLVINCMEDSDAASHGKYQVWGDARHDALSHRPPVVFTGSSLGQVAASVLTAGRTLDKINSFIRVVGSGSLPFMIAARGVARIAVVANENPARDYGGQALDGILPGADTAQELYAVLDAAVTSGVSTAEVVDGVVKLLDTVTFYRPVGEVPPAWQFVKTVVKVSQVLHNLDKIFNTVEWNGAPMIPDNQATTNAAARKPKDAKAAANSMIDELAEDALLSDPGAAKAKTTAVIDGGNPNRMNVGVTVQVSGNTNITDIGLQFGFFFG